MTHVVLWLVLATAGGPQGMIGGGVSGLPQSPAQPRDPRAAQVKGTGSISGRVITADTGVPIPRAVVTLSSRRLAVYTDYEGRYTFTDLPPGQYSIFVNVGPHRADYQPTSYGVPAGGMAGTVLRATPVELADGQRLENVDIALQPSGAITGAVLDADGRPLSRVGVSVMMLRPGFEPMPRGGAQTDDRGVYRIFGLPAGDYVVRAIPQTGGMPVEVEGEPTGFAPTYAPGTPDIGTAMRIRLARGAEATADIRLLETRVFSIRGVVLNSRGEASQMSSVMLSRTGDIAGSTMGTGVNQTGEFTFRGVPAGSYEIIGRSTPQRRPGVTPTGPDPELEFASVAVEVGNADIDNLLIATRPGATVTGQIVFDGPAPAGGRANVFVQNPERRQYMGSPAVEVKGDTFVLKNVFTPVLLRGSAGGRNWGLEAVLLRGRDVTDEPVTFTEKDSGHLQIVFTSTAPSVEGIVTDDLGKPVTAATVLLFGEEPSTWRSHSSFSRSGAPDKDGRYRVTGLREGRYFAVAVPAELGMSTMGATPELLEALSKVATRVTLLPGEVRTVDLGLVRFERD